MIGPGIDRNVIFGLMARKLGFVSHDAMLGAMAERGGGDTDRVGEAAGPTIGAVLVARGLLTDGQRAQIDELVAEHVAQNGGDLDRSLAAIDVGSADRADLRTITASDGRSARSGTTTLSLDGTAEALGAAPPGRVLAGDRYRIARALDRGGLGEVYVARDREIPREVALKLIRADHADDPRSRARFLIEAEVTGGLEHPGIVPVYGLGAFEDGRPYYAMRFIRGESLKEAIRRFHEAAPDAADLGRRPVALRQLLRRFQDVCNAVAYAHSRGVLHRDLKPANVMLGPFGETLVVDWGLAKAAGRIDPIGPASLSGAVEAPLVPQSGSDAEPTAMGQRLGTPAYMSPEQAAGRLDALGPASDVYSLGATLYCLLTGRPPFEGDDLVDLLGRVESGRFRRPRALCPQLDRALEAICLKAMATRPEDRYESPRALADDLDHWIADEPISAFLEPWPRRVWRWAKRHPWVVSAVGGLTVVVVLMFLVAASIMAIPGLLLGLVGVVAGTVAGALQGGSRVGARRGAALGFRIGSMIGLVLILTLLGIRVVYSLRGRAPAPDDLPPAVAARRGLASRQADLALDLAVARDPALRDPGLAVALARRAVTLSPEDGESWAALGAALLAPGVEEPADAEAIDALEHAALLLPDDPGPSLLLATALGRAGRAEEARGRLLLADELIARGMPSRFDRDGRLGTLRAEAVAATR